MFCGHVATICGFTESLCQWPECTLASIQQEKPTQRQVGFDRVTLGLQAKPFSPPSHITVAIRRCDLKVSGYSEPINHEIYLFSSYGIATRCQKKPHQVVLRFTKSVQTVSWESGRTENM